MDLLVLHLATYITLQLTNQNNNNLISLLGTASKIETETKTDSQKLNTIPLKEAQGILLAVASLMTIMKIMTGIGFMVSSIH